MSDENVGGLVELLPCPFCGSGAEFVAYKRDGLTIRCKAFGCVSRNQRAIRLSIDQLREAMANNWNTRVSAHGQPVVWVNPDDLANPHFVSVNAAKEGHEDKGRHYTLPLYVHGQPVVDEWRTDLPVMDQSDGNSRPLMSSKMVLVSHADGYVSMDRAMHFPDGKPFWFVYGRNVLGWKPLPEPMTAALTGATP